MRTVVILFNFYVHLHEALSLRQIISWASFIAFYQYLLIFWGESVSHKIFQEIIENFTLVGIYRYKACVSGKIIKYKYLHLIFTENTNTLGLDVTNHGELLNSYTCAVQYDSTCSTFYKKSEIKAKK